MSTRRCQLVKLLKTQILVVSDIFRVFTLSNCGRTRTHDLTSLITKRTLLLLCHRLGPQSIDFSRIGDDRIK